jgi:hypothetical protein
MSTIKNETYIRIWGAIKKERATSVSGDTLEASTIKAVVPGRNR